MPIRWPGLRGLQNKKASFPLLEKEAKFDIKWLLSQQSADNQTNVK